MLINNFKISIIIPVYNEEKNIEKMITELLSFVEQYDYEVIFINDGSKDGSLNVLRNEHIKNPKIKFISFSRNFGHQVALKAGFEYANGDCVISMDGDLQHPPSLIPKLIEKWEQGFDIVNTIRMEDANLPLFKKISSRLFYQSLNSISDIKINFGSADFRLVDRRIASIISSLKEQNLFYRGLMAWLGYRQCDVEYMPNKRFKGKTKFSYTKMVSLAINGITSMSTKPLQISTFLGFFISITSFLYLIYALIIHFFTDLSVAGWTSVLISILLLGGVQLIVLGIIGTYLGKIFIQMKERPTYLIDDKQL